MILNFKDAYTRVNESTIITDINNNCQDPRIYEVKNGVVFSFSRAFDTCDESDYVIEVSSTAKFPHGK